MSKKLKIAAISSAVAVASIFGAGVVYSVANAEKGSADTSTANTSDVVNSNVAKSSDSSSKLIDENVYVYARTDGSVRKIVSSDWTKTLDVDEYTNFQADDKKLPIDMKVSYKPQYISQDYDGTVQDYLYAVNYEQASSGFFETQVIGPLSLKFLMDKPVRNLSGGELQRVAIAGCLAREADIYLLDEPSAYLDSNQRMEAAKCISGMMEKTGRSALIVDHDIYFIDMVSDSLMVFGGEPGKHGIAEGPFKMREGMNRFLKSVDITFRRDADTHRPRINKEGSNLDRSQKSAGEYYYAEQN